MAAPAFKMVRPTIELTLDPDGTPVVVLLECHATQTEVNYEIDDAAETFCAEVVSWFVELQVNQSFGPEGLWNLLEAHVGEQADVQFIPKSSATSPAADNPTIAGSVVIPQLPFLAAVGPKARSQFTLRLDEGDTEWTQDLGAGPKAMPGRG